MKLTETKLRQIVKEELHSLLEVEPGGKLPPRGPWRDIATGFNLGELDLDYFAKQYGLTGLNNLYKSTPTELYNKNSRKFIQALYKVSDSARDEGSERQLKKTLEDEFID